MEKKTQQREGHPSTRSLPHYRVTPQSDRFLNKKQDPREQNIERFLRIFDLFKPHILWVIMVIIAVYDYFHPSDVFGFLVLIGAAAGAIPLSQAINLLRGKSVPVNSPSLPEEGDVGNQPGENVINDRDGSSGGE
jgi:hypothetical protein